MQRGNTPGKKRSARLNGKDTRFGRLMERAGRVVGVGQSSGVCGGLVTCDNGV